MHDSFVRSIHISSAYDAVEPINASDKNKEITAFL